MLSKREVERIVEQYIGVNLAIGFDGATSFFGRGNPSLTVSEVGEGCACSMLTDEADWNDPFWDIRQEVVDSLALTLLFVSERAPHGFIFEAIWAGDKPGKKIEVSVNELLEIVHKNRIGTKVRYIVGAA